MDLAVSVLPSLEVVGETATGNIELAVRIRFATRVKDARGVVVVVETSLTDASVLAGCRRARGLPRHV